MNSSIAFGSQSSDARARFVELYPIVRRVSRARSALAASRFSTGTIDRLDLEQEILVTIWRALPKYDPGRASVRTFLERVAAARIASLVRTASRQPRFEPREIGQRPASDDIPALELRIDVARVLALLQSADRRLAMLLIDHSPVETSRIMGISRSAVYRGIYRIRRTFERASLAREKDLA